MNARFGTDQEFLKISKNSDGNVCLSVKDRRKTSIVVIYFSEQEWKELKRMLLEF